MAIVIVTPPQEGGIKQIVWVILDIGGGGSEGNAYFVAGQCRMGGAQVQECAVMGYGVQ